MNVSKAIIKKSLEHKILHMNKYEHSVYGSILSPSGQYYSPFIHYGTPMCGCRYFFFSGGELCSHIVSLINNSGMYTKYLTDYTIGDRQKMIPKYIETNVEGINLLLGGLPTGSPIGIYGQPAAGKTILAYQMLFEIMHDDKESNGLIIDTEGSTHTIIGWHKIFNNKFGLNTALIFIEPEFVEKKAGKGVSINLVVKYSRYKKGKAIPIKPDEINKQALFVMDIRNIQLLLTMFGKGAKLDVSDSGKIAIKADKKFWKTDITEAPLYKIVEEQRISGIVVDSISYPMQIFSNSRSNFPERATASNWILAPLHNISETHNVCSMVIAHETIDPMDTYGHPDYTGGKAVKHSLKFIIYMAVDATSNTPPTGVKGRPKNVRELWLKRHTTKPGWKQVVFIKLTERGYSDWNPEDKMRMMIKGDE